MIINEVDKIKVSQWDRIYCDLLNKILNEGELFENRTGIDTLSIPNYFFSIDMGKEFPILQTKKVFVKNALSEMLWIYSLRSNKVEDLEVRHNNIWGQWKIDEDGVYRVYYPENKVPDNYNKEVMVYDINGALKLDKNNNIMKIRAMNNGKVVKSAKYFGKEYVGTIGTAYGWIINEYRQLDSVLYKLKVNPHDRRMIISLWQDIHLKTAVLPSCVWSTEWKVSGEKLNCFVHQRSADVPVGLPFNVSQYAILMSMMAKVSGLKPGNFAWSITDAHIYVNQIDGIKEQLSNYEKMINIENIAKNNTQNNINNLISKHKDLLNRANKLKENANDNNRLNKEIKNLERDLQLLDIMCCNKKPELELANKESFYDFSTDTCNDKEYLKENPTGNKDIKILHYKSAPAIKLPVAQ